MRANDPRLARRWFWTLIVTAVLAMGALYRALDAPPGPVAGLVVLSSGLVLMASLVQADRIRTALTGRPRPLRDLLARAREEG